MLQDKADDRMMRKKAHELKKRKMVMEDSTKRAQEHNELMKKVAARQVVDTMNALTHSQAAQDAIDEVNGAVLVNDYLLKQLHNDPRNHIKEHEVTEMMVGKPKGQIINYLAGQSAL